MSDDKSLVGPFHFTEQEGTDCLYRSVQCVCHSVIIIDQQKWRVCYSADQLWFTLL